MRSRRIYVGVLGVVGFAVACAAAEEKLYELVPHSDSAYAHELFRLQQVDVMKVQQAGAVGSAAENLWKCELILARWEEVTKSAPGSSRRRTPGRQRLRKQTQPIQLLYQQLHEFRIRRRVLDSSLRELRRVPRVRRTSRRHRVARLPLSSR